MLPLTMLFTQNHSEWKGLLEIPESHHILKVSLTSKQKFFRKICTFMCRFRDKCDKAGSHTVRPLTGCKWEGCSCIRRHAEKPKASYLCCRGLMARINTIQPLPWTTETLQLFACHLSKGHHYDH